MDSIHVVDLKLEKANAMLRYRRLQKITTLFRFVEFFVVLIVISRLSALFPVNFKRSGAFFRGLSQSILSPTFVFVVGNSIVAVLYFKSGKGDAGKEVRSDLCEEYIGNREITRSTHGEETGYHTKQIASEKEKYRVETDIQHRERRICRSRSENFKKREHGEKPRRELRRSVTECCRDSVNYGEKAAAAAKSYSEEEMSGEDFRRTVEAFIARQQRLLREEEFSTLVAVEP